MNKFRTDFLSIPHSYYNDTSLLLQHKYVYESDYDTTCVSLNLLSGERYQNRVKLDFPNPFKEEEPQFQILYSGSITGIFCLQSINSSEDIVLWNPTTNEFKVLPHSYIYSVRPYGTFMPIFGFGYDPVNDDYKIIRNAHYPREIARYPVWEIYSLRRNLWRKIDIDFPYCFWNNDGLYMDGICHWLYKCFDNGEYYLVSFYLSNEVYITTFIPLDIIFEDKDKYVVARRLLMLNGSVACFTGYEYADKTTFHISFLGEIGVKESWTKLFVIELGPKIFPIGVGMNGDIFFENLDEELVYFNLCTQMKVKLGCVERMSDSTEVIIYKKNLHSFEN
ncbi:F-box/kelch-repeat protein At3g06240-like [Vicia villosa]|uniref:F-box/kelch-repeat protein At3g06240-like n=1 Tax=Vicia villosa TaxID=3911 RepID=UPI00273C279F|nr:F-box/kelch-repeat protein At3g06240-like [Vicia villosa]